MQGRCNILRLIRLLTHKRTMGPTDVDLKREVILWKKAVRGEEIAGNNRVKGETWILEGNIVLKQKMKGCNTKKNWAKH